MYWWMLKRFFLPGRAQLADTVFLNRTIERFGDCLDLLRIGLEKAGVQVD
jgi:hypothetical protein